MSETMDLDVSTAVYRFVCDNFPLARQRPFAVTDPLLESGIVDSLGLLTIVNYVEETFGVRVQDTDVVAENFGTVAAIAAFVQRAAGGPAGGTPPSGA